MCIRDRAGSVSDPSLPHGRGSDRAGSVSEPLTSSPRHLVTSSPRHPLTRSLPAWLLIAAQVIAAIVAALNLLPPAWTPQRMVTPEFQQQTAALVFCLSAVVFGPLLALLPQRLTGVLVLLLSLLAAIVPVQQFLRVLPEIAGLYNHPLVPGWGMYVMLLGLCLLTLLGFRVLTGLQDQPL